MAEDGETKDFDPDKDLPSLKGKVIFITGGTAGLGHATILTLAKHSPAHIYFTGRNVSAATLLIEDVGKRSPDVPLTFIEMDMTSLVSVKEGAAKFKHDRLDVLMCNAGIMATPQGLSKDGFEIQFAVNHLAHAMLIQQLLPVLRHTANLPASNDISGETKADVRIICLTSTGYRGHPRGGIAFNTLRTTQDWFMGSWIRYGQSKLANIVYARELARKYPEILTVSVHPGVVKTGLVSDLSWGKRTFVYVTGFILGINMLEPHQGCYSQVWLVGAKKENVVNGGFYMPIGLDHTKQLGTVPSSQKLADELWKWTQDVLKEY